MYSYYFTHQPNTSVNYDELSTLGAFHGAEVPFAFYDAFELATAEERALSAAMGCYWRNFAHTGDPNRGPGPCLRGAAPPHWPEFAAAPNTTTLQLDTAAIAPIVGLKTGQCEAFLPA